jgi:predicted transcriptional regulator
VVQLGREHVRAGGHRCRCPELALSPIPLVLPSGLSVNLSPDVAEALQWIAEKHGSTVTDAVRRCISTQKYVEEALDKKAKILIAEEGQPVRELVFV